MTKIIVIGGPTASGKTTLAIELAKRLDGEIINADSMQIYKEMQIGTARPTKEEMQGIKHYLFGIKSVADSFSVADYQKLARETIAKVLKKKKVPILIGGTGLYLKSVLYDYDFQEVNARENETKYDDLTNDELYQKLVEIDPEAAAKTHPHNRKRVLRALQISESGTTKTEMIAKQSHNLQYDCVFVGLTMSRKLLYERIDERIAKMMEQGLTGEAKKVLELASPGSTALQAIGYKEFIPYFNHSQDIIQTVANIKTNTHHYAKRQYTFFNNQFEVNWYNLEGQNLNSIINDIISIYQEDK